MLLYKSWYPNPATGKTPLRGLVNGGNVRQPVPVPCSKCWGCRLERSRQWAIRCMHEAQMHENNCFITLTYSEENLTYGNEKPTLYPRDLQLFFKRLRKRLGASIRYFSCGEYGEKKGRPHYHVCLFGYDFPDKKPVPSRTENQYYSSQLLAELWPHGGNVIGELNFETAAYTARYIMKKKLGRNSDYYEKQGLVPEFTRMSLKPGIGTSWYERYKSDVFPSDFIVLSGSRGKMRPPRYYGSKYELTNPEQYGIIKDRRQKEALKHESDNKLSRLRTKERIKKAQTKTLSRNLETFG